MKTYNLLTALVAYTGMGGGNAVSDYVKNNVRKNLGGDRIVHIGHEHLTQEAIDVLQLHSADHFGRGDSSTHFRLSPDGSRALNDIGVQIEDATEEWITKFETNFQDENFFCSSDDCASRDMQDYYSSFQSLESIHARSTALANSVDFAQVETFGESFEGRNLLSVRISDDGEKPMVLIFCNIHAREWLTPMYCTYMIEMLVEEGGHSLLDTFTFVILPVANPDGYVYSITDDNLWRKTRRPNEGSACVGTDANRNYNHTHCGPGTSNDPCSDIYCGPTPFSEMEAANIRDFGIANQDRLVAVNDVHAYSKLWMTPYGGLSENPPAEDFDRQQKCSLAAVEGIQSIQGGGLWDYGPIYSTIYEAAGVSVDYFYETLGVIYSATAEVRGNSFQPSPTLIMVSNQEVFTGIEAWLLCVKETEGLGPSPSPQPAPTSFPTSAGNWTCEAALYNEGDFCDCECGMHDPDCDNEELPVFNCFGTELCINGLCSILDSVVEVEYEDEGEVNPESGVQISEGLSILAIATSAAVLLH